MTSKAFPQPTARGSTNKRRVLTLAIGAGTLALLTVAFLGWRMSSVPAGLDLSRTQTSQNGHFEVAYEPAGGAVPVNEPRSWTLNVTTPEGRGVEGAHIAANGGMPGHGHGLASQPRVTRELGDGRYLVEGFKFQMGGWWVVDATITAGNVTDTVRFNLQLE